MHGVVHPPSRLVEAHPPDHLRDELPLALDRKPPVDHGLVDAVGVVGERRDHRHQLRLELGEQPRDLGALHPRLVVVEQHVVGALEALEAVHVTAGQLEVPLEVRDERREVRVRARLDPRLLAERGGPCHLRGKLGRHADGLLATPLRDRDQARVVGIGVGPVELAARRVEQPPVSSETNRSCRSRSSVARPSARPAPPCAGIIVCWSQSSSCATLPRSDSSAVRSRSRSMAEVIRVLL